MAWNGPMWVSSWHNFAPEVTTAFTFPERLEIYDWTLEGDGEAMPGMAFTKDEKLEIARILDEIHVQRINAGSITSRFPEDIESVREIAQLGLSAKVEAFVATNKADVDLATKSDVSGVSMELPSSDAWIEDRSQSRSEIVNQSIDTIDYAKEHGLSVTFGLQDATRADQEFLQEYVQCLTSQTKLDAILVADSMGAASPEGFKHLIRMMTRWTTLPVAIHCHNDFGLATANALAGVTAGASTVTTTMNGVGERCGLTSLEELAVALRVLYNIDLGIKLKKLCEASRIVEGATRPLISKLKPVVGERAFAWEADRFMETMRRFEARGSLKSGLPYEPDLVGNEFRFFPGKKTGIQGVRWEAEKLGFTLSYEQTQRVLEEVKQRLANKETTLTDRDFRDILLMTSRSS